MAKTIDKASFAYGIVCSALLVCAIGAAENDVQREHRYDAAPALGGLGLSIVDHDSNTLHFYKRHKQDDAAVYELVETIDLALTGEAVLPVKKID